ncbi:MAG: membrane protein insertase YidC, partial [Kiritimatiellae bacterium]|nr:membrane protein insertase YidC [Kiritimatiellia bacterium]
PLGVLEGVDGLPYMAAYGVKEKGDDYIIFTNGVAKIERKITLKPGYKVVIDDSFGEPSRLKDGNAMSMGVMTMGKSSDDILSIDGRTAGEDGDVMYYGTDDEASPKLYSLLSGGTSGGCGCGGPRKLQAGEPVEQYETVNGKHDWIALKDRFFVTALVKSSQDNKGFTAKVNRDIEVNDVYRPYNAGVDVLFGGGVEKRTTEFFVGPKKQSLMSDNGMKEVMDFGFWSFLCYPMVWILNFFWSKVISNYGVAIILLTVFVRLIFWPLTRKSTEGMKKMQEIQPLLKELQAKFKDNPQRLQQETFALYREKKVNPLSSCLPMLIQIPIFIALFNVLRSMVELRYAGFLWIDDLSAPEHLFASSWFPWFGGLNILPILMAATMYLQSKLTPSAGDPNQQRMMTVIMPIMMLVMFYNFASALSLYWTVSQILSIVQMWMMRRKTARKDDVLEPEVIDPPSPTRQMRRHS